MPGITYRASLAVSLSRRAGQSGWRRVLYGSCGSLLEKWPVIKTGASMVNRTEDELPSDQDFEQFLQKVEPGPRAALFAQLGLDRSREATANAGLDVGTLAGGEAHQKPRQSSLWGWTRSETET